MRNMTEDERRKHAKENPRVVTNQRDKKGKWRLRNLIVETVNLGVIYRNQFQAAARDAEGDLNVVIDNWTAPQDEANPG